MSDPALLWAAWTAAELTLTWRSPDGKRKQQVLDRQMPAGQRYFLRPVALGDGSALLRSADGSGAQLDRVTATQVQPLPGFPDQFRHSPPYRVLPQPDGTVIGLSDTALTHWPIDGRPRIIPYPEGFEIRDATCGRDGELWIAGSLPARRPGAWSTRAAWARRAPGDDHWDVRTRIGGGLVDAWRGAVSGARSQIRWIRECRGWLVLAALGGEPDDSSTYLAILSPDRTWTTRTWSHDVFRAAIPLAGGVAVFSHRGQALLVDAGSGVRTIDVAGLVRDDEIGAASLLVEIHDASVHDERPIILAALRHTGTRGSSRHHETIYVLDETALAPLATHGLDEPEIIALTVGERPGHS